MPGAVQASAILATLRNGLDGREFDEDLTPNQFGNQFGKRLNNFGISSQKRHQPGGPDQRVWKIRAGEKWTAPWLDAFVRYGIIRP